jgi:hypothetical protein
MISYYQHEEEVSQIYRKLIFEYIIYCLKRKTLTIDEVSRLDNLSINRTVSTLQIPEIYHNFIREVFNSQNVVDVMRSLVKKISPLEIIEEPEMRLMLSDIVRDHILTNLYIAYIYPGVLAVTTFFRNIVISESFIKQHDLIPISYLQSLRPDPSLEEMYKLTEDDKESIDNYFGDNEHGQILVSNIIDRDCSYDKINFVALLIVLLQESGHLVLRLINPSLTDLFNNTFNIAGEKIEDAGRLVEEMLFGQVLNHINVNVVKYLLNINSWKDETKEFMKILKEIKELDFKLYNYSSGKILRKNSTM